MRRVQGHTLDIWHLKVWVCGDNTHELGYVCLHLHHCGFPCLVASEQLVCNVWSLPPFGYRHAIEHGLVNVESFVVLNIFCMIASIFPPPTVVLVEEYMVFVEHEEH